MQLGLENRLPRSRLPAIRLLISPMGGCPSASEAREATATCTSTLVKRHVVLRVKATRSSTNPFRKDDDSNSFVRSKGPFPRPDQGTAVRRAQSHSMMPRSGTGVAGAQRHERRQARRNADRRRGRPASGLAVESGDSGALQRFFEIAQPVASPFDVDYVRPVQQTVEDGGGKNLISGQQFRPGSCWW